MMRSMHLCAPPNSWCPSELLVPMSQTWNVATRVIFGDFGVDVSSKSPLNAGIVVTKDAHNG